MTDPKPMNLYSHSQPDITLQEALNQYAKYLPGATALLYSPEDCQFALLIETVLKNATGEIPAAKLSRVFEARIFNETYELRWLNQKRGTGTAVLLWDCEGSEAVKEPCQVSVLHTLEQTYILWGEETETVPTAVWSTLTEARIETINVPISLTRQNENKSKSRVQLKAREYLAKIDNYGNVAVVEERLLKLEELIIKKTNG